MLLRGKVQELVLGRFSVPSIVLLSSPDGPPWNRAQAQVGTCFSLVAQPPPSTLAPPPPVTAVWLAPDTPPLPFSTFTLGTGRSGAQRWAYFRRCPTVGGCEGGPWLL